MQSTKPYNKLENNDAGNESSVSQDVRLFTKQFIT